MRKVVIFIKYFVFCLVIGVPANIYGIYVKEFISNINGLTNNSVNCILEDSENVIWVGTWDGLNAYNGRSILSFRYTKIWINKNKKIRSPIILTPYFFLPLYFISQVSLVASNSAKL